MKVKSRIYLLQFVTCVIVLTMASVAYVSIRSTDYSLQRIRWANHQLAAITTVTVDANRFSEQIAELLLIGEAERADYLDAARNLESAFDDLDKVTRGEAEFMAGSEHQKEALDEQFRVKRMRALYVEMNGAVPEMIALRAQGRNEEAVRLFRREIENRLDAEFEHLLAASVLDEQEEVELAERQADALWTRLTWIIALATLSALALSLAAALRLSKAIIRPVDQLIEGAEAISRGELGHRIAYGGSDELGVLAQRFNQMGEQLQEQRTLVDDTQANLERQVTARTLELAEANGRLTAIDRSRLRFLADISHELRTPLTALRGEAEITLRHTPKPETEYRDALERIVVLAHDMGRLVDDLLFLARSETDTLRFELGRVALGDVISNVGREANALGRSKGIEVCVEIPEQPAWILADARRLKQALMIVLDNAIKYSPNGTSVAVSASVTDPAVEDPVAVIMVRDQGRGIPANELPKVFDRFYRGMAPSGTGSGLGLAIAKWLVEKHGGDMSLKSEEGIWTEVHIRIPVIGGSA